ncbi:hypothetical protein [Kitasatospora cineracea]|uniref:Uncharacterized protein n=1 Tax=Kitasatospora cineracea TaxID=88074 RepID=A0A3N4R1Z8_9ACTN|nr:hypothetical protein [Kitasatospora cineracea]RPE26596.1 hypothetical protein EDD38_7657 [Kitasatospora cineracea]
MPTRRVPDSELVIRRRSAKGESSLVRKTVTVPAALVAEVEDRVGEGQFSAVTTEALHNWVSAKKRAEQRARKARSEAGEEGGATETSTD